MVTSIVWLQAQCLECIGAAVDLSQKFAIRKDAFFTVLAHPDDGDFVPPPAIGVAIETVVGDVAGRADEPLGPGVVPPNTRVQGEPLHLATPPQNPLLGRRMMALGPVVICAAALVRAEGRMTRPSFE